MLQYLQGIFDCGFILDFEISAVIPECHQLLDLFIACPQLSHVALLLFKTMVSIEKLVNS